MENIIKNKGRITILAILGFVLVISVVFYKALFYTVAPGHEAYVYYTLSNGLDTENVKGQGLHFKAPWDKVVDYDVRIKEQVTSMQVLSNDGLTIQLELSYRYQPFPRKSGFIEESIGSNYHDVVIAPTIYSVAREVIGQYNPEALYAEAREKIEGQIFERAKEVVAEKNINLDAVLIRDLTLPAKLQDAIEGKLVEEERLEQLDYTKKQALVKDSILQIQADAQYRANKTLEKSLTEPILRIKAIEASLKLAESNNTKVVVIGGDEGVPFIFDAK